ncbi:unnamed protein product [Nezara viridula]|uniref:Uncharacterized protein n=1 Tax=Nezara viridula TaxID=85310 RepID=A0A9P0E9V3_NEZVI|nr:unnamed protein product [Nezara viridula]
MLTLPKKAAVDSKVLCHHSLEVTPAVTGGRWQTSTILILKIPEPLILIYSLILTFKEIVYNNLHQSYTAQQGPPHEAGVVYYAKAFSLKSLNCLPMVAF